MHPPRLGRLDQIYPGHSIYFITCCTHQRRPLLANSFIHESFLHFCASAKEREVLVGRYVLMPDHLHFFIDPGEKISLSLWMKSLKNSLSKILRQNNFQPPHWQKGFFDHLVRSMTSYEEKWNYAQENPVRAKLVHKSDEWPYQGEIELLPFV